MIPPETLEKLKKLVGAPHVLTEPEALLCYSYDSTLHKHLPEVVVRPGDTAEVSAVLALCNANGIAVTPRGAGTNLSGGTVPSGAGVVLSLDRMNKILDIDPENLTVTVQPAVVTQTLAIAVEAQGLFYPPDPSSWSVSTIAGNIAENAGGPRAFKYGVTRDYVMGLEVVLANGDVLRTGGKNVKDVSGYDMTRLFVGSEGTLGVITEATLRLVPKPEAKRMLLAIFPLLADAARSVAAIVRRGIIPTTLELMDATTIQTVEDYKGLGLPRDVEAVLIIEVDGRKESLEPQIREIEVLCREQGANRVRVAESDEEAEQLWLGRRSALAALSRARPTTLLEDATVPRSHIAEMVAGTQEIAREYDLRVAIFGHAGDGNLHPTFLTDETNKEEMERVDKAAKAIFKLALSLGGTITGEHGVGISKAPFVLDEYGSVGVNAMKAIKKALDPAGILNPGKIFPQ
jgi:glycolate oxidase